MVLQDLSKVCKTSHKNTVMHIVENIATYANKQKRRQFICRRTLSGVSEIRTRDTLLTYTRFPGVPLQPLEHHSIRCAKVGIFLLSENFSTLFSSLFFIFVISQ